jgi:putative hemolysin
MSETDRINKYLQEWNSINALLRNGLNAFGKGAIKHFPLGTDSRPPFWRRPRQKSFHPIPNPVDEKLLLQDVERLSPENRLYSDAEHEVICAKAWQMPHLMPEIGRLREVTFRGVGEGTGKALDVDVFDTYYDHLFVWHRSHHEIVGAYRIGRSDDILAGFGKKGLYTSTLFKFKKSFFERLGPALELGRSFVRAEYQRTPSALFLLWKGIGQFVLRQPRYQALFGPVSISSAYQELSRQLIVDYLRGRREAPELSRLVKARAPFQSRSTKPWYSIRPNLLFRSLEELSTFISTIEADHKGIPILLKQYVKLGAKVVDFNVDADFCASLDALIVVDLWDAEARMLARFIGEGCVPRRSHP